MPSWKKVITSGSDAALNTLTVSNGITGSLFGTSSYSVITSQIEGGKATHIPFFNTDTTLATSSIYQSGSSTVIINQDNATTSDPEALYVWQPHPTSVNVISGKGNLDSFLQLNIQNTNQGTKASSDVVATANNGNNNSNYIDMGINGGNYQVDHTWWVGSSNDTYLVSVGGNHYMGSVNGGDIRIFTTGSGFDGDASTKLLIRANNQHEVTGSLNLKDTLYANSGIVSKTDTIISGTLSQLGDYTHTGSVYRIGNQLQTGNFIQTGSITITGSTTQIGNNTLIGSTFITGSLIISSSQNQTPASFQIHGDVRQKGGTLYQPVNLTINPSISGSYIFSSGSTNDLYFAQTSKGYTNVVRLRWLEGNLYTGLLHGGLITSASATTFNISSGSGIVVNLNASLNDSPYPTAQYVNWENLSNLPLTYLTSSIQTFLGIDSNGQVIQQTEPWNDGQYNTSISLGTVLHQNLATINGSITYPNVAYGYKQRTYDFIKAFGPLKLSGLPIIPSGTLGLTVGSGTAWADGRNYQVDPNNPSYIIDPGTTVSKIFRYYQSGSSFVQDTNGGLGYTAIDPTQYNPGGTGVLTPVPRVGILREWSIQRVFWYPNSATKGIVVYYGNASYATETDAIANVAYEQFNETPNTQQNAVYLGALILRNNATFADSTSYKILPGGIFRNVGGSGGGGSVLTSLLSGLSDVAISGPTDGQPLVYNTVANKWVNSSTISASLSGNASTATTASYAITASYALNSIPPFPYTGSAGILGSLNVTGEIIATSFTGSLQGTATNAISSSYATSALTSISSSYATAASSATTADSGSNFVVTNTLRLDATLTDYATTNSTIVGVNNLYTQATSSFTAAFCKYTLSKGANARAGEFMTVWNGTDITYTDTATTDIGDTSDITFISSIVTGNIQISTIAASTGWNIKGIVTYI